MRGASADALAALSDKLDGSKGAKSLAGLGDDLFGLAAVLRAQPAVRRVVTDPSTDAAAKSGLVRQLFDGKVDAAALELVADAVERRWSSSRDLPTALEQLGVVAVVKSAGKDASLLADELFSVGQLLHNDTDLRSALSDPARSVDDKRALVRNVLDGKVLPATVRLTEQALAGTYRTVNLGLAEYQQVASEVQGEMVAEVRAASTLSDKDRTRLQGALSAQYGRPVHLNVVIDPDVIGGLRVEIGDDVIDGTVASRLDQARRKLAG
jgi:F-type H+-transporting ATPase subunit delta